MFFMVMLKEFVIQEEPVGRVRAIDFEPLLMTHLEKYRTSQVALSEGARLLKVIVITELSIIGENAEIFSSKSARISVSTGLHS